MREERLQVLQAVRLKGRTTPPDVAAATGQAEPAVTALLGELAQAGHVQEAKGRYRLTPEGKEALGAALAEERAGIDTAALEALYERFDAFNSEFKELASAWQQRDGQPNDHGDAAYDQAILDRVADLHGRFLGLVQEMGAVAPRLAAYPARFTAALERIQGGDHAFLLRPIIDSYHTVWFELHEDL
ncbi:MAG TPA: hypothetical protein VD931_00530, partial [Baekduia sp.]|nr:hypothetical protein [Baekduia sp.]